jgi:tRNA-binding EMAP/Myf-like protein
VLRTHTSPVQVRTMEAQKPPIRIVIPGKTYRRIPTPRIRRCSIRSRAWSSTRARHVGHMRWVLEEFCKAFFEVDSVTMRFRPSFFPFTEPSLEVDIQCDRSGGEVASARAPIGWRSSAAAWCIRTCCANCGLDPDEYQGFAWGMGIDRIAMLKYGMPDLRAFFDADVRWLSHYGFRPLDMPTLFGGLSADEGRDRHMKFTLSWLKDHLETDATLDEICERLTAIGLEVEDVDDKAAYKPFVIAKVVSAEKHPSADKLKVLMVDAGDGKPVQVVCGAPNARAGLVGALARPGTYVPGIDVTLSVGKIRGVESHGMMCSERELDTVGRA